jgi:hypothetical protein
MTRLTPALTGRAATFIWLTGRVLDQRRMVHFQSGDAHGMKSALDAYASEGAYAFGVEPDIRGPRPQPLTVMTALAILDEAGGDEERMTRAADWLGRHVAGDGGLPAFLPDLRDYPRPPWVEPPDAIEGGLLPTGRIAGLLHKHGIAPDWLGRATDFCWAAIDALEATHPYEVHSAIAFLDGVPDRDRAVEAAARLGRLVRDQGLAMLDPAHPERFTTAPGYADDEFHYAYDYAHSPESVAAQWFSADEMAVALDRLAAGQQDDGGWQITWRRWAPTTESEARPGYTIERLRILRAWD